MHSVFLLVNLIDNLVVSTMVRPDLTHSLFSFIPLSPLPITFTIGNCQLTDLWLDHFFTLHFIQSHISVFTFVHTGLNGSGSLLHDAGRIVTPDGRGTRTANQLTSAIFFPGTFPSGLQGQ